MKINGLSLEQVAIKLTRSMMESLIAEMRKNGSQ